MGYCIKHTDMSLFDLQDKLGDKTLMVPPWQRGDAWSKKKKAEFEYTIKTKAEKGDDILSGCVILYITKDDPQHTWISDGKQRTLNAQRIYEKWAKQIGEENAKKLLSKISVPVLKMHYENEKEAKDEFRRINQGTSLTDYEQTKTILTDLPNHDDWDNRVFSRLHTVVSSIMTQFGIKNSKKDARKRTHGEYRDNYALFLRYFIKEKEPIKYNMNISNINNNDPKKRDNVLEQKLVNDVKKLGIDEIEKKLNDFEKYLINECAYIKKIWEEISKDGWATNIVTLSTGCLKCLLHVSIYRKNNSIPLTRYERFLKIFLDAGKGRSQIKYANGKSTVLKKGGDIKGIQTIQRKLNCIFDPNINPDLNRSNTNTDQLSPGQHNAHKQPYSKNMNGDDGDTIPIPGLQNTSMGVLPLDNKE